MGKLSFDIVETDRKLVDAAAKRAVELALAANVPYELMDAEMDLIAAHANGCPLDFARLVAFDDANFGHDVFGIRRHLNRNTGELLGHFLPRCAKGGKE